MNKNLTEAQKLKVKIHSTHHHSKDVEELVKKLEKSIKENTPLIINNYPLVNNNIRLVFYKILNFI